MGITGSLSDAVWERAPVFLLIIQQQLARHAKKNRRERSNSSGRRDTFRLSPPLSPGILTLRFRNQNMCGIYGFAGFKEDGLLDRMGKVIHHRGPDGGGRYDAP